uniref:Uncharacterized protein n=1 Tax=Panagrolaimus sp. JU765 TaxID=591449 RepID=A0AC34R7X7_9BILA
MYCDACVYFYDLSMDRISLRGCYLGSVKDCHVEYGRRVCFCTTDLCDRHEVCYISSDKTAVCDSHCSTKIQPYEDRHGYNITKGCSEPIEKDDKYDAKVTSDCGLENDIDFSVNKTVCQMFDTAIKECLCIGEMCNYLANFESTYCYASNGTSDHTLIKCPLGTTHCYFSADATTGKPIKKGCSVFHEENKCKVENNVRTCICEGDKCNGLECFIFNGTSSAELKSCPQETAECYVARDPRTLKLIEAGCYRQNLVDYQIQKCDQDGCNYPMYCHDYELNDVIQCDANVTSCFVNFEKLGIFEVKITSGCSSEIIDDPNSENIICKANGKNGGGYEKYDVKSVTSTCGMKNDPSLSPSVNGTVCRLDGTHIKKCICTGDMCNYLANYVSTFCYNDTSSDTMIKCPLGTTHCYISADATTGKPIKKGCSSFHEENKCNVENNVRTCVCKGDKCNDKAPRIDCFVFNGTMAAQLKSCPQETAECYIARDSRTLRLIEGGCYQQKLGDYKIQKCDQNGCNYPMYCHDYELNGVIQCDANVTSCFVNFENVNGYEMKVSSGCNSDDRLESSPQNILCEMNGTGGKKCVCPGDMCNHERNYDSVSCFTSNDTGFEMLTKCPMDTTHCYSLWDKNNGTRMGCSVFDEKEGCQMENNKKICVCQGDGCNQDILNVKCFVSNITKPAKLEVCPYEALDCYSIRDPESLKTIEIGCGVSQNKNAKMCADNGCNYPHHCYNSQTNGTQQCAHDVTTCYTIFEGDYHYYKVSSGCDGRVVDLPTPSNGIECKLEGSKKLCSCSGDMCNYEKNFELTKCIISDGKDNNATKTCPFFTTHCFYKRDVNTERIFRKQCSVFEKIGEGCVVQDDVETCQCVGDGCNSEILLDTSLPFAKLYRYAVYPHLA